VKPTHIFHADWGTAPKKRWLAVVRQIAVPYLKRISSYLAEVLRFEIAD
jgi:hypothetical protein